MDNLYILAPQAESGLYNFITRYHTACTIAEIVPKVPLTKLSNIITPYMDHMNRRPGHLIKKKVVGLGVLTFYET